MGGSSGGDEKMSVETMWMTFAFVTMGLFSYAFLKPMCAGCCTFRKKPKPKPVEVAAEPEFRTIKIHPARAQFRLFPPGEAFYLGAPKRHVEPKPKKKKPKKEDNKWKKCVQSIVANNAIRDIASPFPRIAFEDEGGEHVTPRDPRVFSGLSTLSGRLKLNGGPMNNFAKIVQLARLAAQKEQEDAAAAEAAGQQPAEKSMDDDDIENAIEIKDDDDEPVRNTNRVPINNERRTEPDEEKEEKTHETIDIEP